MFFLLGAAFAGAAVGFGLVNAGRIRAQLALRFEPDELHWCETEDGWQLPIGRYLPKAPRVVKEPVILCHGMGANRFNLDFDETYSLARHLARKGFECFVVELRGMGITKPPRGGKRYAFHFDELVQQDLPALVRKAREISGAAKVLWVGHSKGGIVAYAWCGLGPRPELAGVVAIGSPLIGAEHFPERRKRVILALSRLSVFDVIHVEPLLRAVAPFNARRHVMPGSYMASTRNMDPWVSAVAMHSLLENIPTGVSHQMARWIRSGRMTSWDGKIDYQSGLARSRTPFLLIAGAHDMLAPPASLEAARDAMVDAKAAGLVEYVLAGTATGFSCDYGHGDLVLGRDAPREIFPRIDAWLKARGTAP